MKKSPPISKYSRRSLAAWVTRRANLEKRNELIRAEFEARMEELPGKWIARCNVVCHELGEKHYLSPQHICRIATGRNHI